MTILSPILYQTANEECIDHPEAQKTALTVSFWNRKGNIAQLENKILLDTSLAFCYKFCGFLDILKLSFHC